MIGRRSDAHFKSFIHALVNTGQEHFAELLDKDIAREFIAQRDADRVDGQGRILILTVENQVTCIKTTDLYCV